MGMPALKDGENWHRGYTAIKSYLSKLKYVDEHLSLKQKADVVAWGSLIEDLGDTLAVCNPTQLNTVLTLQWNSLFVSRQNFLGVTRREISLSLHFPHGFFLPTRLRAYANRRCAEIGTVEDLEDQERPTIKDGFSDNWLTRRRTWDEKARSVRVRFLTLSWFDGSCMRLLRNFIRHCRI
jgi:Outer mitochondrial membrane transport complex protein